MILDFHFLDLKKVELGVVKNSLDALNDVEYNKMNRILEEEYNKKRATILDRPLGDVLEGTVNFFSNSFNSYADKFLEAKFSKFLSNR